MVTFEMLTGLPPWFTTDRKKMFTRIRMAKLQFPSYVSDAARGLIAGLLDRDPIARMGSAGIASIQQHPFFAPVDWRALELKQVEAPFKPKMAPAGINVGSLTGAAPAARSTGIGGKEGSKLGRQRQQLKPSDYAKLTYNFNPEYARLPFDSEAEEPAPAPTPTGVKTKAAGTVSKTPECDFDRFTFDGSSCARIPDSEFTVCP
jgi:hypothetical protein